ncbi:MAG: hypothetical protein BGO98_25070 [Myxococcales bacterium 68-20]|nr:DUF2203 domain-containing protein [Myxococcales bacterium]OJY15929.1 MAG: hypothetical protein BGO98_25070 [Myxococcales bacterium 68-20]
MEHRDSRVFTLEEVNDLVPKLSVAVKEQLERRSEIESLLIQLGRELGDVPDRIVLDPSDPADLRALKRDLVSRIEVYRAGWKAIEDVGAVLKDARMGLLDFYGTVDGKLVWLCWRYGESEVAHYHALTEGFSGRKPIAQSMRSRHLN